MDLFLRMGRWLEARFRERDYDDSTFPDLALEALQRFPPATEVDPYAFLRWAADGDLPAQMDLDASFGEPPVTVFRAPRFYVEVLFWLDGTTQVHQHGFSGAFHVLAGSSLHAQHRFDVRRRVSAHFQLGELTLERAELLTAGQSRPIRPGPGLIHSLFHLDRPSVSVVVRTYRDTHALPQLSYLRPHVAVDPKLEEPMQRRRLQLLKSLSRLRPADYLKLVSEQVKALDLHGAYEVLDQANDVVGHTRVFPLLLEEARARHGDAVDLLVPVFAEKRRQAVLIAQRELIQDPGERFFVALALNLVTRGAHLSLLRERWPDAPPVDTALRLFERVTRPEADPRRETPTAVAWTDAARTLVRGLLEDTEAAALAQVRGQHEALAPAELAAVEALARTLTQSHPYRRMFTPP